MTELMERLAVREVLELYLHGVDARDREAIRACFDDAASARYHLGTPDHKVVEGGDRIAGEIHASCARFTASNHSLSNVVIRLDGDEAFADTFAVAHVVVDETALVRGLRYEDRLSRSSGGWLIVSRRHTPLWQISLQAVAPKFF